jgi:hypothetical protein
VTKFLCLSALLLSLVLSAGCKSDPRPEQPPAKCAPKAPCCKEAKAGCGANCAGQTPKYVCPCPYCACTQGDECVCDAKTCANHKCKCGRPGK